MAKPKKQKGKAKDQTPKLHGVRNPFACDPIMRKACVHEVTNKAKRKKAKLAMKKALSKRDFDGAFSLYVKANTLLENQTQEFRFSLKTTELAA